MPDLDTITAPPLSLVPPFTPELLDGVRRYIEGWLVGRGDGTHQVLELGSGYSTLWFNQLGCITLSLEHDPAWVTAVQASLPSPDDVRYAFYRVILTPVLINYLRTLPDCNYDLILLDCIDDQRPACLQEAPRLLKPRGLLVIDDTHWDLYNPYMPSFSDWRRVVIDGYHARKTGHVVYHQTTLLWKDYNL